MKYGQGRCTVLGDARVGTYCCDTDGWMIFFYIELKVMTSTVRRFLVGDKYCRNVLQSW